MKTVEEWKEHYGLSDGDILTKEYLKRVYNPPERVQCACGCGKWRARFDGVGVERRYIWGHAARGRKPSAETIEKIAETKRRNAELGIKSRGRRRRKPRTRRKTIQLIRDALSQEYATINKISKKSGVS